MKMVAEYLEHAMQFEQMASVATDPELTNYWRARGKEMRSLADGTTDEVARQRMLNIADDYERLVKRAEQRQRGE